MNVETGEIATAKEVEGRPDREQFRPLPPSITVSEMATLKSLPKAERTLIMSEPAFLGVWLLGLRCRPVAASERRKAMRQIQKKLEKK